MRLRNFTFFAGNFFSGVFGSHVCVWILPCQKEAHRKKPNKVILYIKRVGPGIDSESGMIVAKYYSGEIRQEIRGSLTGDRPTCTRGIFKPLCASLD